ncbi:MAG: LLM class flavin-dependent oxidoreductase, partial [Pseudomonadota bacterium]|nr:LLM class flavin-dependent oxidoreductase [Pseudomonadota bacterium]
MNVNLKELATSPEDQRRTNPLYSDRKLGLGTFCTNLSGGCTISTAEGNFDLTWPNTATLALLADDMEFEALVPVGRWKGFGGETNFNGQGFESYTWAAGIGAMTRNTGVFSTSHISTVHPLMAAKQGLTIDHITGGRFTLNVVCGWFGPEFEMFGAPLLEHDRRYELAAEWLTVIKRLWTEEEEFDFDGEFFQLKNLIARPHPVQRPHPAVMSAGASPRGKRFAAEYADVAFTGHYGMKGDDLKNMVTDYRKMAMEEFGREIKIWTNAYIYQGETEKDARALWDHFVIDNGDQIAATNLTQDLGIDGREMPARKLVQMKNNFIAGWGGYPIIGTKEQVVEGLLEIADAGFDGTLLTWPRYIEHMEEFRDVTYPLVCEAGLR